MGFLLLTNNGARISVSHISIMRYVLNNTFEYYTADKTKKKGVQAFKFQGLHEGGKAHLTIFFVRLQKTSKFTIISSGIV